MCVCGLALTDGAWQLREGVVGEQQVLEVVTATDLLIHHLYVVLGNIQVGQLLQHPQHLDSRENITIDQSVIISRFKLSIEIKPKSTKRSSVSSIANSFTKVKLRSQVKMPVLSSLRCYLTVFSFFVILNRSTVRNLNSERV